MPEKTRHLSFGKNALADGFTLIELSIVLVIIALIIGGIMLSQSMVRQSQVMSVIVDEKKYVTAARAFRDKYNALPGDMSNATNYWGTYNGCPPNSTAATTPQTLTCNGNGNGIIDSVATTGVNGSGMWEAYSAWVQLVDAGFIQGGFTGTGTAISEARSVPGVNVPASRVVGAGFNWIAFTTAGQYGNPSASAGYFINDNITLSSQYILFGGSQFINNTNDLMWPTLTGAESASLDQKIDDGNPLTGAVMGGSTQWWTTSACVNAAANNNVTPTGYNMTLGSTPICYLLFATPW